MQISKADLTNIIDELESATNDAHTEYCYSNHCGCAFELIAEWRKRIEEESQDTIDIQSHICGRKKGHFGRHKCSTDNCNKTWQNKKVKQRKKRSIN